MPKKKRGVYAKWQVVWIGPCRVVRKLNDINYIIQKTPRGMPFIVHVDRLKQYFGQLERTAWMQYAVGTVPTDNGVALNAGTRSEPDRNRPEPAGTSVDNNSAWTDGSTAAAGPQRQPASARSTETPACSEPITEVAAVPRPVRTRRKPARYLNRVVSLCSSICRNTN